MLGGAAADLTPEDMDRNRSARRANTLQAEAILSMKQVEMEQGIVSSSPPKEGKMDVRFYIFFPCVLDDDIYLYY